MECEEQVLLVYTPSRPYLIHALEIVGHFVRENAIVTIEENNSEHNVTCMYARCMNDVIDNKVDANYPFVLIHDHNLIKHHSSFITIINNNLEWLEVCIIYIKQATPHQKVEKSTRKNIYVRMLFSHFSFM